MDSQNRYTNSARPRGTHIDAEKDDTIYLLKNVSLLHLTYQIRLATFLAVREGKKLVISVPSLCEFSPRLQAFRKTQQGALNLERD